MSLLETASIYLSQQGLLGAIWYSDGSGGRGLDAGISGIPDDWKIIDITLEERDGSQDVRIDLMKEDS